MSILRQFSHVFLVYLKDYCFWRKIVFLCIWGYYKRNFLISSITRSNRNFKIILINRLLKWNLLSEFYNRIIVISHIDVQDLRHISPHTCICSSWRPSITHISVLNLTVCITSITISCRIVIITLQHSVVSALTADLKHLAWGV